MVTLLADRLHKTVAPASAAQVDGGTGAHRSSQISTWSRKPGTSPAAKIRSLPNGASCPARLTSCPTASRAAAKWRFS